MAKSPSPNGSNGRDARGRFARGNAGGKGNPHAKRVGQLRSAMLKAITDQQWKKIIKALVDHAVAGEPWAVREVLDRTLGKPVEIDLIERLDALEQQVDAAAENSP